MVMVVNDSDVERRLREERAASGADRYDEVWERTYMMSPMPNDEHQELVIGLGSIFEVVIGRAGLGKVRPGINVSDRKHDWRDNYRVPDVAVFLQGGQAENCGAFWHGGPDFAVEIISPGDRTLEKLSFYEHVAAREVLVVDREPWRLLFYRLIEDQLAKISESTLQTPVALDSAVLPFTFRLVPGHERPQIEVVHIDDGQQWTV